MGHEALDRREVVVEMISSKIGGQEVEHGWHGGGMALVWWWGVETREAIDGFGILTTVWRGDRVV